MHDYACTQVFAVEKGFCFWFVGSAGTRKWLVLPRPWRCGLFLGRFCKRSLDDMDDMDGMAWHSENKKQ